MVRIKSAVLRVLLVSIATVGYWKSANAYDLVKITPIENSKKAVVTLSSIDSKQVLLSIENRNQSEVFYSAYISTDKGISKVFDFTLLPDGEYYLIVKQNFSEIKKVFKIENSEISAEEKKTVSEPEFTVDANLLLVNYAFLENKIAKFSISSESDLFYSESLNGISIKRKYDISQLPKGNYIASISDDHNTYSYIFDRK